MTNKPQTEGIANHAWLFELATGDAYCGRCRVSVARWQWRTAQVQAWMRSSPCIVIKF